ncbi:MAG: LysM peptidoglycan-binding domain-containing protein [Desulfobacterales bacterium]|jgi:membrane-bound lytic murein transglycosylase D
MKNIRTQTVFLSILPVVMALYSISAGAATVAGTFPEYESIRPNISFWKKIYAQYSTTQGVIHDKRNLGIIYEVIELKDRNRHGSRKINRDRIKKAKKKYKLILAKLAGGEPPKSSEEKRVANLFGAEAQRSDFRSAMRNLRCQVGQKDPFRQGIIRSGAYLAEIKQIFRDAGLPTELSYLPHVESSFNPKAYSKFGAAGIWQFTRSTGKRFMTVGYAVDERRDPILSSHAAARLLKQNFKKLGSWPMAITAYNHGIAGMLRAQRRKGSYEAIFKEYHSRIFKFASRNFYAEFLAAREVAQNYRQYFGELALDTPFESQEVVMAGYGSLPQIARQLKLAPDVLRELNPALRNPVIRGQKYVPKGFRLRFPLKSGQDWERMMAELAPKIYKNYQKRSHIYTVQRGDTAGEIARLHGVKLRDLIAANNLNSRATIYVNQNLRIPLPDEKPITIARKEPRKTGEQGLIKSPRSLSIEAQPLTRASVDLVLAMNATAEPGETPEKLVPGSAPLQPVQEKRGSQTSAVLAIKKPHDREEQDAVEFPQVEPATGEARKEEPPLLAIKEADLVEEQEAVASQDHKQVQEKPEAATLPELDAEAAKPAAQAPEINPEILQGNFAIERIWHDQGKPVGTIRVEVEETLGHYAEWLDITAWEIRRLNGFPYGKVIRLDQQIKIPLHQVSKEEFEEKRFEYHKELSEDFFASYRVEKVKFYYIKKGDTIWDLSLEEFEVPLWLIKKYNVDLDFSALFPSQKLLIPIIEKIQV